jgi:hypothetical protein
VDFLRIAAQQAQPDLRLGRGSVYGSFFQNIEKQVGLTGALLSAHVLYISIAANEYGEVNNIVWTLDSGQWTVETRQ